MDVKIDVDLGGVLADLDELQSNIREKAAVSAVNKTLAKAQTRMVREITAEFNVSASYVRDRLSIKRATFGRGIANVAGALMGGNGKKRSANLINFLKGPVTQRKAKRLGLQGAVGQLLFQIKRKGKAVVIPGAFVGNQGRTVFIREGKARLPIKALSTIDVPQMFNTKRINKVVVDAMQTDFAPIFAHEVEYFTQKFSARRAR